MARFMLRTAGLIGAVALVPALTAAFASSDVETYRELDQFMSVFERIRADYVEQVDDKTLLKGAIDGMLASLDPHSSYFEGRDFANMRMQTDGNYGGVGLVVGMEDGAVRISTVNEGTPAARGGLKTGDYITHLDGKLVYGGSLDETVEQMRGKPGSQVRFTIVRPGRDKPFDLTLTREVIQVKSVLWEIKDKVGIININGFSRTTGADVRAAIASIDKALGGPPLGYVVDLRSNPGGLLDQAVEVSDAFLERGEIVSQRGRRKDDIERYYAKPGDLARGLPVVTLVDAGSASAAEVVAAALQDHRRGLVLGERSFGKGSVQTLLPMGDNSALRITTARYYTPSGRSVQEGGIDPDIRVPQLSDPDYKTRPRLREADLRRHLINEVKIDDRVLEDDSKPDPRFAATAESLEKGGVGDYQLDYAVKTIARLSKPEVVAALGRAAPAAPSRIAQTGKGQAGKGSGAGGR